MKRAHVLVVDDDPDIRGLVKELLERQGYGVSEAANGKEALRALYATPPDVVLLDVSMPELDGWQTLERIRDLSDVPVAMLTARAAELEKVRGLKAGADDYITKPFGRQELLARIEAMLRRAGPREEAQETYADSVLQVDFAERSVSVNGEDVALDAARVPAARSLRAPSRPAALARPGAGARVGRLVLGLARPGQALRRLPAPQARGRRRGRVRDRDRARLRLPLPARALPERARRAPAG